MEYRKIINLLENAPNQLIKFRTKHWVEINDDARGTYNTNSQIIIKTSKLKSSFWVNSDPYILVKGTITMAPVPPSAVVANYNDKEVVFKNCVSFTDFIN